MLQTNFFGSSRGWSGGGKVLGKLPVPGRPTILIIVGQTTPTRTYCKRSRCGWGLFGHFTLIYPFSSLSPSLWEMARYRLKYCLKGPLNPKQPTNQKFLVHLIFLSHRQIIVTGNVEFMRHFLQIFENNE